jgi:quercetin dioxygenase-like cupin family protein
MARILHANVNPPRGTPARFFVASRRQDNSQEEAMKRRLLSASLVAGCLIVCGQQSLSAQETAPKGNKGFKSEVKQTVDLGPEFDGMNGKELRMRILTIEPGGYIGLHSHKDRPAVVYFLKGTDTVLSEDGTAKTFRPGDSSSANKGTMHWHSNRGKEPVVVLAVDILKSAK